MADSPTTPSIDGCQERVDQPQDPAPADIAITARGERRAIEALYLELRALAKQKGLEVEYRLSQSKPGDQAES